MTPSARRYFIGTATLVLLCLAACATPDKTASQPSPVLFVCEHGNVKSLMASSFFNQMAEQRHLPFRAISRGSAPDSDTVPPRIIAGLSGDGFDVSAFHPVAVSAADVKNAHRVVTIGVPLSSEMLGDTAVEQWNDVPPASVDYAAARASLKAHVGALLDGLAASR